MSFTLRYYQEEAISSIFAYFAKHTGNPVIALPTGLGKSLILGGFIQRVLGMWPKQRFLMLTHVKELVEQNADKLLRLWPEAPLGIHSAGLGQRDVIQPIIFGGIASVSKSVERLGHRDLIIVDEAHAVSPKEGTMYQQVLHRLRAINPNIKVIGLSATPFRLGQGMITDDGLFTDICYDGTGVEAFNRFIAEGYLSPVIPRRTKTELDLTGVGIQNGDYKQAELQRAVDKRETTYAALEEIVEQGQDRKAWLIFASGIEHAEHITDMLGTFGVDAAVVHSKLPPALRDQRIAAFKRSELRCLVNNSVLTTGFDHPPVDLIGMLRPTVSPGLWVQMVGRGTRPSPETEKRNCLVLDFAKNTARLGPINDPVIPRKKGNRPGEAPVRICEKCGTYNHARATHCIDCGFEFPKYEKLTITADTTPLIQGELPEFEFFPVKSVIYKKHVKDGSRPTLKVTYHCGLNSFYEWICFEHTGYPRRKAEGWWMQRYSSNPPETVDDALLANRFLRVPKTIKVWINKRYPEVVGYEF